MTSLQLPYWMEEMVSEPSSQTAVPASLHSNEEFMLFDDNFASDFLVANNTDKLVAFNTNNTVENQRKSAEDLLLELEQGIKNEPSWFETSASPILFDENQPKNTDELLVEFETVCNAVGVTPPPSPPQSFLEGAPIYYVVAEEVTVSDLLQPENMITSLSNDTNDESVDFIDELVRSHSNELPDLDYDFDDSSIDSCSEQSGSESGQNSPQSDSGLSPRSDDGSSFAGFSIDDDDEEWTPSIIEEKPAKVSVKPEKRKKRPYGRAPEEKKVRKKEQNKNAATRYRQKKRQQLEDILRDEEGLKAVHLSLQTQYDDVKREINYLKKLMREILIAKGVQI